MKSNCLSYSEIVNYFGEDKIADRYKFIYDKMQSYIEARGLEKELYIHVGTLHQAVMDYFVDIYRTKQFHKIDKADITKILAYEVYWILRRKPIQPMPEADSSRFIFANEGFVTTLVAHECLIDSDDAVMNEAEEEILLEFLQQFNYHLKYRGLSKQDLELMLYAYQSGRKLNF